MDPDFANTSSDLSENIDDILNSSDSDVPPPLVSKSQKDARMSAGVGNGKEGQTPRRSVAELFAASSELLAETVVSRTVRRGSEWNWNCRERG